MIPRLVIVPFERVPEGADEALRRRMYEAWLKTMRLANPRYYNADGTPKSWWRVLLWL
jgi:hypothetical protein